MNLEPEMCGTGNYIITFRDDESRQGCSCCWVLDHGFHSVEEAARNLDRCAEDREIPSEKLSIIRMYYEEDARKIKEEVADES